MMGSEETRNVQETVAAAARDAGDPAPAGLVPGAVTAAERFTLQIQGKGLRFKARIPGWMVAAVVVFVKTGERKL